VKAFEVFLEVIVEAWTVFLSFYQELSAPAGTEV
jgi:hypothetical protein